MKAKIGHVKKLGPGTYSVPQNDLGIIASHPNRGDRPLPHSAQKKLFVGPLGEVHQSLKEELEKPVDLRDYLEPL